MHHDYFISHATEDKDLVARPLAHYLRSAEFLVWFDEFSLKVGDSLRASIDDGLSNSEFGVVILSKSFFAKSWPQRELAGLVATASTGASRILPVWHDVTAADVVGFSPMLADLKAASTTKGLQFVAEEIVGASAPDRLSRLPLTSLKWSEPSEAKAARETLLHLLENRAAAKDVRLLLSAYHVLLKDLFGYHPMVVPGFKLNAGFPCDFAVVQPHGVTGPMAIVFVVLGPVDRPPYAELVQGLMESLGSARPFKERPGNDFLGPPYAGQYSKVREVAEATRLFVKSDNIHWSRPEVWSFSFLVLCGRRDVADVERRDELSRTAKLKVEIASYDRLLDTAKGPAWLPNE